MMNIHYIRQGNLRQDLHNTQGIGTLTVHVHANRTYSRIIYSRIIYTRIWDSYGKIPSNPINNHAEFALFIDLTMLYLEHQLHCVIPSR